MWRVCCGVNYTITQRKKKLCCVKKSGVIMSDKQNQRAHNFACITYHTEEVINAVLTANSRAIKHYAFICHDKDLNEKGELKERHFHVILQFYNARTVSAVRKMFPSEQNSLAQIVFDKSAMFAYLTHEDKPEKMQYPIEAVTADDMDYWQSLGVVGEADSKTASILSDLLAKVPLMTMVARYGRDFVINYSKYVEFARLLSVESKKIEEIVIEREQENARGVVRPYLIDEESGEIKLGKPSLKKRRTEN